MQEDEHHPRVLMKRMTGLEKKRDFPAKVKIRGHFHHPAKRVVPLLWWFQCVIQGDDHPRMSFGGEVWFSGLGKNSRSISSLRCEISTTCGMSSVLFWRLRLREFRITWTRGVVVANNSLCLCSWSFSTNPRTLSNPLLCKRRHSTYILSFFLSFTVHLVVFYTVMFLFFVLELSW